MAGVEYFNVREEFADVDFHDARLEKRFIRTQDRRAVGANDGKNENADTDVFCNICVHNELDLYGTCIS
ncbi:MAG: transposase [Spirochaetaceae bacterium]|jgi:hypothetical protein|nr:transposase [Spirochaetaceae bacterium]